MSSVTLTVQTIDALDKLGVEYMVVGAISSNIYGIPRATKDADIVVQLGNVTVGQIANELGDEFSLDRQLRMEGFTGSIRNNITHIPTGFLIELFRLSSDPHHRERFRRRVRIRVPDIDRETWVPTAEDVVIQKLRWARPKDLEDVRAVLAVQSGHLDLDYMNCWVDQHGTRSILNTILSSI
jgi:hypothetical protein